MAGDPLRDAFRARVATIVGGGATWDGAAAASGTYAGWNLVDTLNTTSKIGVKDKAITLRFNPAWEEQATTGAPGANLWREGGDVMIDFYVGLGTGHDAVELVARAMRDALRALAMGGFAMTTGQIVRPTGVTPMGGDGADGGYWVETVAVSYKVFNTG